MNLGPFISDHIQSASKSQRRLHFKRRNQDNLPVSTRRWQWRAVPVICACTIMLLLLGGRLWQLQIIQGEQGRAASRNNSLALEMIPAPRGIIYDANGQILARNNPSFRVAVTYAGLPPLKEDQLRVAQTLGQFLDLETEKINKIFEQASQEPFLPVTVKKNIDRDTEIALLSARDKLAGITIEQDLQRYYPYGVVFSHVLGYTGSISQQDKKNLNLNSYHPGEDIGQSGIEQIYEKYLHGSIGKKFSQVNALGQAQSTENEISPQPGDNLTLSIDADLQKHVYDTLVDAVEKYQTKGAVAVFQDPGTGKVLSLVSAPGYNTNLFSQGISDKDYQQLINNPLNPLFNRAIAGTYPPGSTVKPLVAAAAIQEGVITPYTRIYSPNQISVGGSTFADWTYWLGRSGPGNINAIQAIAQSTDTFFYKIGGGYEQQPGLGIDALYRYLSQAGLGSPTGIDLPGEVAGVVPNPAWKAQQFPQDPGWYIGNTYQLAIGQSYLLSTPLQINVMTSAIANDGQMIKPQIVEKITTPSGELVKQFTHQAIGEEIADHDSLEIGRKGMREGVENGIIFPLRNNPFNVAAKTGTAEFGIREIPDQYGTHSWITGYAPYDKPQISFTILLEGGGSSTNAAEVANEILEWYHQHTK